MTSTIGIWPSRSRLIAVEISGASDAHARVIVTARAEAARRRLAEHALSVRAEVVITDTLLEQDPFASLVVEHGVPLWIVPDDIVAAIIRAVTQRVHGPKAHATILARLVFEPLLHAHLRRIPPRTDDHQLRLF